MTSTKLVSLEIEQYDRLRHHLARSWIKKGTTSFNSASLAITPHGEYASGLFESRTNLLDITSESAALALAVSHMDPQVNEVISLIVGEFQPNPIVIKILTDHARRTGQKIAYKVYNANRELLFVLDDVSSTYYQPTPDILGKISTWKKRTNKVAVNLNRPINEQLNECAMRGTQTHFSSNSKSLYGAAVLAGDMIYYGGVYSSYDKRLNLHAEMVAVIGALADGRTNISKVAVVSTKFTDAVPAVCGCCRQFLSEIQYNNQIPITLVLSSFDLTKEQESSLNESLPGAWSS